MYLLELKDEKEEELRSVIGKMKNIDFQEVARDQKQIK